MFHNYEKVIQQQPSYSKEGTVTVLDLKRGCGIITDKSGYRLRFAIRDAHQDVALGSRVTFRLVYPHTSKDLGVADAVAIMAQSC